MAGQNYRLLGVKWYAAGLFVKDECDGTEIRAPRVFRVEAGDFVYNRLFAWKGSFAVAGKDVAGCYVSNEFPCFIPDPDKLDVRFLWRYLSRESAWTEALGLSSGGTPTSRNRLKEEALLQMTIPLPPPAEQRRIVGRIEELVERTTAAQKLRQEASAKLQHLYAAAQRKLFPPSESTRIKDVATLQSGYAFKSEWFSDDGIRLVRNVNIGHGRIQWGAVARIPSERRGEFSRFDLREGDILITLDRPIISTGVKVAQVQAEDLPSLLLQRVARVQFRSDAVMPEYLFAWLQSPCFVNAIDPGRSNGVPHISPKDVEQLPFHVPPLQSQRRTVEYLHCLSSKLDALKRLEAETSDALDALVPSILDRAVKGEL